jgi:DNA mismatch repair enzyme (predicted ATPase)
MPLHLEVQITQEHLGLYKKCKPVIALSEFVWNALDADASNIDIKFMRNELASIESITISDDGCGISFEELNETFGKFGSTYKKYKMKSPGGRVYHGKLGNGRYKGFAIGNSITWESTYKSAQDNKNYYFQIVGQNNDLKDYFITDKKISINRNTGTKVTIDDIDENICKIDTDEVIEELGTMLAPYLLAYPGINIFIDDRSVKPKNLIEKLKDFDIIIPQSEDDEEIKAKVKIIQWKTGKSKNRYLCSTDGIALTNQEPSGIRNSMFPHSVYILSDYFEKLYNSNLLEARNLHGNYRRLIDKVEDLLKNYYREILADNASESIQQLKVEGVYPFENGTQGIVEKVERQVFDICAAKVVQYLPGFNNTKKKSKKFTLQLLKEALSSNPNSLKKILTEVIELPQDQQDELADILEKTSLDAIIGTTKMITERLSFINGLEQILFAPYYEKHLKERSQLQKILLGELWIFGEQYNYGCDDISLKNVLHEYLKILGMNEMAKTITDEELETLNDIPDICLYRQYTTGREDEYENLVIELKRPSVKLGAEELQQIQRYAFQVMKNKYFDKEKTKWTFILTGNEMDEYAKMQCNQVNRASGLLYQTDKCEIWVKLWNQVIQEAKGRHKFLKDKLEYSIRDNSEGMNYLKNKYSKYIPEE